MSTRIVTTTYSHRLTTNQRIEDATPGGSQNHLYCPDVIVRSFSVNRSEGHGGGNASEVEKEASSNNLQKIEDRKETV